jgi:hypothetical protein
MPYNSISGQIEDSCYKTLEFILHTLAKLSKRLPNEKNQFKLLIDQFKNRKYIK